MKIKHIYESEPNFGLVAPVFYCCCCCFLVDCSGRDRDDKPAPAENNTK